MSAYEDAKSAANIVAACDDDCPLRLPYWEGVEGAAEHRTVGPHRAWCIDDREWCYPRPVDAHCPCCKQALGLVEVWVDPKRPAIVVDGKVVELDAALALLMHGDPDGAPVLAMAEGLTIAARRAARGVAE